MDVTLKDNAVLRPAPPPESPAHAARVLLIEDDPSDRALVEAVLCDRGTADGNAPGRFELSFAESLADAHARLAGSEFDVVLLDLELPDAFGVEGIERLSSTHSNVPIVVLTGVEDSELAEEALALGAQDYLPKGTLDRPLLERALRHAIQRQRVKNQLEAVTGQLRAANSRLAKITLIDPLTSLLNRRGLQQALTREGRWSERDGEGLSAMLIDLDDFRKINGSFGHSVGDVVLQEVARLLRKGLRPSDYVGRVGGDQFLALLPGGPSDDQLALAEKLRLCLTNSPITSGGKAVRVTASVALCDIPEPLASVDALLGYCHRVLSAAKQDGKNRIARDAGAARGDTQAGPASVGEALDAMRTGRGLRVARQRIVRLGDESTVGWEFLARSEIEPFRMPDAFFGIAQENELLSLIDQRFLELGCDASARLEPDQWAHVNVFPSTLIDVPPIALVEMIRARGRAERTCLEISEQQIIGDPSYLARPVAALREAGVRIAIDDVGFGRSSLESLIQLEPDVFKLDRLCLQGLLGSADKRRSLVRLLAVARTLEAEVIAEGIESREDLFALQDLGVRYGQGYLWGRPI